MRHLSIVIVWTLFLVGGALGVDPIRGTLWVMACMLTICAARLGRLQAPGATIAPNTPQSAPQGRSSIVGRPRGTGEARKVRRDDGGRGRDWRAGVVKPSSVAKVDARDVVCGGNGQ